MADNTQLNPGSGGDLVKTEDIGAYKLAVSKIYTGAHGVDGGAVTPSNPLPIIITAGTAVIGHTVIDSGSVAVSNFPGSQVVTGTFWQSTQPVSIATMPTTPVTGVFWQTTQPVSGTVTANIGTAGTLALETGGNLATLVAKDFATQTTLAALSAKVPALGQAVAGSSVPVVLTAAQITTLTPLGTVALGAGVASIGNVTKTAQNQTVDDGAAISWKASGGSYVLTCTSVTNGNAQQGGKGDLGTPRARKFVALVTFSVASAATAGLEIEVWWAPSPSITPGTLNPGSTTGVDGTFNTTPTEYKAQLQFLGSLVLSNNAGTGVQAAVLGPFIPKFRYGMPVIINASGQALSATAANHTVTLYPMQDAG